MKNKRKGKIVCKKCKVCEELKQLSLIRGAIRAGVKHKKKMYLTNFYDRNNSYEVYIKVKKVKVEEADNGQQT